MASRRRFVKHVSLGAASLLLPWVPISGATPMKPLQLSLAQWSLHRAFENGRLKPEAFASIASREFGFKAVEYVNGFYRSRASDEKFWIAMRQRSLDEGVKNLLIMVDEEGELGSADPLLRQQAIHNHYKWVNAAKLLGCHSIRINAFGQGSREVLKANLTESLEALCAYAGSEGISVLIENHGLHTSDAGFMVALIKTVASPWLGTLPDFGNWCLSTQWGSTQGNRCQDSYDPLEGLSLFLPFAKGVSAKSYAFDQQGQEVYLDYPKMLRRVYESGYRGYIGIEYEGEKLSEPEGIRATRSLIERVWADIK